MLKAHFQQFAAYNAWANGRLYDQAGSLSDQAYRRPVGHIESLSDDDFEATFEYRQLSGARHKQIRREALAHLFNHQTHHRSQAHTCLSVIGADPLPLDLLYYQRNL